MKNMLTYIKDNMDGYSGEFKLAVTDMSEIDQGFVLISICPLDDDTGNKTEAFLVNSEGVDAPFY